FQIYSLSLHDALPISPLDQIPVGHIAQGDATGAIDAPIDRGCELPDGRGVWVHLDDPRRLRAALLTPNRQHVAVAQAVGIAPLSDRKSTRLNSSHVKI